MNSRNSNVNITYLIFFSLLFSLIYISGCGEEETSLEIFSPDAYAYPMENGWELNGSFRVKGLKANKRENRFEYEISYSLFFTDDKNNKRVLFKDALFKEKFDEEQADIGIDFQAELDSTFKEGKYKALIKIEDNFSRKNAQLKFDVELSNN